ncbi:hypothetical protein [Metabacillus litoralis]|uniref:hypothetical protein n=1 Tax=Metabacillus litoralis TaxID=152268 RepID=UPI00203B38AB|nr:hypothetical protein [Metabacillus litoralis]MCM3163261.1 hypothetical protein [Metabacillus litoralis]
MTRYFKYVSIRNGQEEWMIKELNEGRARFGWSSPGSNLHIIKSKEANERSTKEKVVWRYTQFLINRLKAGDRLIIQLGQPLRQFLIAEIVGEYGSTDPQEKDFNHYVECKLLTNSFIQVKSEAVSQSLRHHLSKRGHYYEIYDEDSKEELDLIVKKSMEEDESFHKANQSLRSIDYERTALEESVVAQTYKRISKNWPSAYFEQFVSDLIDSTPGLEVKKQGDSGKGWDLTMRILDPLDGFILHDDIPVQCKNYQGKVNTKRPLDDLERCIRNSDASLAYLFIIGDLSSDFYDEVDERVEQLRNDLQREVKWRIIEQEQIAKLYLKGLSASS